MYHNEHCSVGLGDSTLTIGRLLQNCQLLTSPKGKDGTVCMSATQCQYRRTFVVIYIGCMLLIILSTNCGKYFVPLSLSIFLNHLSLPSFQIFAFIQCRSSGRPIAVTGNFPHTPVLSRSSTSTRSFCQQAIHLQTSTKSPSLPVQFRHLVILCQYLRVVSRFPAFYIISFVHAWGGSVAEWLACWTQVQNGLGSNRSRDAVG